MSSGTQQGDEGKTSSEEDSWGTETLVVLILQEIVGKQEFPSQGWT